MKLSKRILALGLCAVIVWGILAMVPITTSTIHATSTNLLAEHNYSFEEAEDGTAVPADWTFGTGVGTRATLSTAKSSDQSTSLRINNQSSPKNIYIYSAYIPVEPGDEITASMDMSGTSGTRGFYLRFYANDTDFSLTNHLASVLGTSKSTSWTTVSKTLTAPTGAAFARLIIYVAGSTGAGVHYYDNAVITKKANTAETTAPTGDFPDSSMLYNHNYSFEDSAAGTFPVGWTSWGAGTQCCTVVTDEHTHGSAALRMDNSSGLNAAVRSYQIPVTPGDTIRAFVDVKGNVRTAGFLRFYRADDSQIADNYYANFDVEATDTWKTVSMYRKVPSDAVYAQVWLYAPNSFAGIHYFDNVVVVREPDQTQVTTQPSSSTNPGGATTPGGTATPGIPGGTGATDFPYDNMLKNYNFDFTYVQEGTNLATHWQLKYQAPGRTTVVADPKNPENACLLFDAKNNPLTASAPLSAWSEMIPVVPGDVIKLSVDVLGDSNHGAYVRFFKDGTYIGKQSEKWLFGNDENWQTLTINTVVPEGANGAQVWLYVGGEQAMHYYDNVLVTYRSNEGHALTAFPAKDPTFEAPGNIAYWTCECGKWFADAGHEIEITNHDSVILPQLVESDNLLQSFNPSFENGVVGGIPSAWTDRAGSKDWYTVTNEKAYDGKYSWKLTVDERATAPRGIYSGYFPISNEIEKLSLFAHIMGEGEIQIYMYFYDADKKAISNVAGEKAYLDTTASPKWEEVFATFTVPEGAVYGRIMPYRTNRAHGTIYVDNLYIKEWEMGDGPKRPREFFDSFEDGGSVKGLPWGWSYYTSFTQNTEEHKFLELVDLSAGNLPDYAPNEVCYDKTALAFTQISEGEQLRGIYSPFIDVNGMKAVFGGVEAYGGGETNVYIMYYDENYVCPTTTGWRVYFSDTFQDEWGTISLTAEVPEGAAYARLLINKSYRSYNVGTTYFDGAFLKEGILDTGGNVVPDVPEYKEYEWTIEEESHPRVFFDSDELRRIKKFTRDEDLTSFGYSGKEALDGLLSEADYFMRETEMVLSWGGEGGLRISIPVYPELDDPTNYDEFRLPPNVGYSEQYPYMTNVSNQLRRRMMVLALAYVMTGDVSYGERAVQYAVDASGWEYWVGQYETIETPDQYGELSAQPTAYMVYGVATVYDLCYSMLTPKQREVIETALIEKGLEPMYHDCDPRMERGRDMDHMATSYLACAAILNESNIDMLSKYLNKAAQYTEWIFNWYDNGHNEGYDYAASGIDQLVEGLGAVERATGWSGMLDHHFITETFVEWAYAAVEMGKGTFPGYSDSPYRVNFIPALTTLAKLGDTTAGYLLHRMGGASACEIYTQKFRMVVYYVGDEYIVEPDDDYMNVSVAENMGTGSLRTGWGALDKLMFMISDDYGVEHSHWEANSIFMAANGQWLIKDVGYGSIALAKPQTQYDMKWATNTIYVDGKPQSVKGSGSTHKILGGDLYGQIMGSAPEAYGIKKGQSVLSQFDRHAIMMNHDSESYYVVIDELDAPYEHVYGFNMYHPVYDRMEVDGIEFDVTKPVSGNHISVLKSGQVLHYEFVGDPLEFKAHYYSKSNETFGPLFRADGKKATDYKFMTVISVDPQYDGVKSIDSSPLLSARTSKLTNDNPDGFSWKSSNNMGMVIALPLTDYNMVMLRASSVGDWMSFPFVMEESGEFLFSVKLGAFNTYAGKWQVYLDGEPIGEPYYAKSNENAVKVVPMGLMYLEEGKHTIKVELIGEPNTDDLEWGTLISIGQVVYEKPGSSLGIGDTKVEETYNDANTLGATIQYGTVLRDIILTNRGNGSIAGGGLVADAQQATVMGLYEGVIKEGFAVVAGTSAKYGDLVLMTSDGPINMGVDYRLAKEPVKNTDDDEELVLDEDLNYNKPTTIVNTNAVAARKVSIQVGNDAPFVVTIDGETVETTYADGLLSLTVPAGEHYIKIVGTHHCIHDRHSINIANIKTWATCTDPNVYYVSCYCGKNGTETFIHGEARGHKLYAVDAKEATEVEDGCIPHFACKRCDLLFADEEGKMELSRDKVILPKLTIVTPEQNLDWIIWVAVGVVAAAAIAVVVFFVLKKTGKKKN